MPRQLLLLAMLLPLLLLQCDQSSPVVDEIPAFLSQSSTLAGGNATASATPPNTTEPSVKPDRDVGSRAGLPNVCEGLVAVQTKRGGKVRTTHRRDRYVRTREDRRRTKELIRVVAREMGVRHPEFFVDLALHESTWNPEALHILNPDEEANRSAWARHTYSRATEATLERRLETSSAKTDTYWKTKRRLASLRRFQDNPFWYDQLRFPYLIEGGATDLHDQRSVWSFGYGLFGHNAVLYVPYWGTQSPPWVLCAHEGVVATIIEVWAARKAAKDCAYLTRKDPAKWGSDGDSYRGVLRRLARGHCGSQRLGRAWQAIMASSSVPWSARADFGDAFPRQETSRREVLAHMLEAAEAAGALRETPLARRGSYPRSVVLHAGSRAMGG